MSKRRRSSGNRKVAEAKFWGVPLRAPAEADTDRSAVGQAAEGAPGQEEGSATTAAPSSGPTVLIRPTPDPGALIRSLGPPPLAVDGGVAERHLTAVYEEAVRTATALAAANGLLASDDDG